MSQPPKKGNMPGTFTARGKNSCSGTQTNAERKYFSTTVQMSASTCASVPQKTSTMANANSTTVSRSDETTASTCLTDKRGRGFGCGTNGSLVVSVASSLGGNAVFPINYLRRSARSRGSSQR